MSTGVSRVRVRAVGGNVTGLKIECQPRKKCHNIPRVRSTACFPSHLSLFLSTFSSALFCCLPVPCVLTVSLPLSVFVYFCFRVRKGRAVHVQTLLFSYKLLTYCLRGYYTDSNSIYTIRGENHYMCTVRGENEVRSNYTRRFDCDLQKPIARTIRDRNGARFVGNCVIELT